MHRMNKGKSTHSDKLERWLGADEVARISSQFKNFYYPVPLQGVPGKVFVMPGGDFAGEIQAGQFANKRDKAADVLRGLRNRIIKSSRVNKAMGTLADMIKAEDRQMLSVGAFASVNAVIAAVTGGKGQTLTFSKTGVASTAIGNSNDLWTRVGMPIAGGAASAAPGGLVNVASTPGSLGFKNLGVANSGHYLNWALTGSIAGNSLLMYDRIFSVAKTMNSTATEAVTGVPTRYQNTVAGANDYVGGNFCFPANPTTILASAAHNWTVCTYVDEANIAGTFPSAPGATACVVGGVDLAAGQGSWFMPLAAGDFGVKAITQMQCSALILTGSIDFVIGHPIAINTCPIANIACMDDGLYTALNLNSILDNACLSFLELPKPATTATSYSGIVRSVSE